MSGRKLTNEEATELVWGTFSTVNRVMSYYRTFPRDNDAAILADLIAEKVAEQVLDRLLAVNDVINDVYDED